jgi:hypothetical protein
MERGGGQYATRPVQDTRESLQPTGRFAGKNNYTPTPALSLVAKSRLAGALANGHPHRGKLARYSSREPHASSQRPIRKHPVPVARHVDAGRLPPLS